MADTGHAWPLFPLFARGCAVGVLGACAPRVQEEGSHGAVRRGSTARTALLRCPLAEPRAT